MAAPKVKFKRSSVAGKQPLLTNLELGELALNTYDGKLFTRQDTSGVGIGTTVTLVNPWDENYGGDSITFSGIQTTGGGITTDHSEVTLSGLSPSSFNQTYDRQSTGFTLDTGTVSSGNALFNTNSNYYYYVASTGSMNTSRMLIFSEEDNDWVTIFDFNGTNFTEGNVSNDQAIGSSGIFTTDVTSSSTTADGRNVPTASGSIVYGTTGGISTSRVGVVTITTDGDAQYAGIITASGGFVGDLTGDVTADGIVVGVATIGGLKYPVSDGANNQVLVTDGSGNLSFADQSGGGGNQAPVTGITTTTSVSGVNIDSVVKADYDSVIYNIQAKRGSNVELTNFTVIHDGTETYITQYATVATGPGLSTYTAAISGANLLLRAFPTTSDSTTFKLERTRVGDSTTPAGISSVTNISQTITETIVNPPTLIVSGIATFKDKVHLLDNDVLHFGGLEGDAGDLQIYHDTSNSYIKDAGTGALHLLSGNTTIKNAAETKTSAVFNTANSVDLYFNNSKKFETSNTGITVTGTVAATSYTGDGSALSGIVTSVTAGSNISISETGGAVTISANVGSASTSNINADEIAVGVATVSTAFYMPQYTTSERDAGTFNEGAMIYNTESKKMEFYDGTQWLALPGVTLGLAVALK